MVFLWIMSQLSASCVVFSLWLDSRPFFSISICESHRRNQKFKKELSTSQQSLHEFCQKCFHISRRVFWQCNFSFNLDRLDTQQIHITYIYLIQVKLDILGQKTRARWGLTRVLNNMDSLSVVPLFEQIQRDEEVNQICSFICYPFGISQSVLLIRLEIFSARF